MKEETLLQPGDIVEFIEQKKVITAVCLSTANRKSKLLTETSRLMSLSAPRFIHVTHRGIDPASDRKSQIEALRNFSQKRKQLAELIDLESIWLQIHDSEQKNSPLDLIPESLISTLNGLPSDIESAFLRKIIQNRCYFRLVDNKVQVFTHEEVQETQKKLKLQQLEQIEINELAVWLHESVSKVESTVNNAATDTISATSKKRLLAALKADAAGVSEQPDKQWVKKILKKAKLVPQKSSFQLLVDLQEFSPDENLYLYKFDFPTTFSDEAIEELHFEVSPEQNSQRMNLENLKCFTIDGTETTDMDDALSVEYPDDSSIRVGIHITDVSSLIRPGNLLDLEARERGLTLYLPDRTWHMFPGQFAEDIASLRGSKVRPCLSTFVTFSTSGEMISQEVVCSKIKIHERLTYDEVDGRIQESDFSTLLMIGKNLRQRRIQDGAILMPRPEVSIDATTPGKMIFRKRMRQSPSQLIVSEMMILANSIAANIAAESGLPYPFRTQPTPSDPVPVSNDVFNPHIAYTQRRLMPRAENSLKSKPHFSLGLKAYTNITSPLRRYFDVVAQRQLKAILGYEEPYSHSELKELMSEIETSVSRASAVTYQSKRYWYLKYLRALKGKSLEAIVLDRFANRYQIWLEKLCMDADLPPIFGAKLRPEQTIKVVIEKVSPRENILKLRLLT